MNHQFKTVCLKDGNRFFLPVPFDVWMVTGKKGNIPARVLIDANSFECKLIPKGQGKYYIPIAKEHIQQMNEQEEVLVTLEFIEALTRINQNSPYDKDHPIRTIDGIRYLKEPKPGLCIQTCLAMLAGISVEESIAIMKTRQASISILLETLAYLGIAHGDQFCYRLEQFPKCCLINCKGHFIVQYDGLFYDPSTGIFLIWKTRSLPVIWKYRYEKRAAARFYLPCLRFT